MNEASKAHKRRKLDPQYAKWISGNVLDVGCGKDPVNKEMYQAIDSVFGYDVILGHKDAATCPELDAGGFDCVHASHVLEHLPDPKKAVLRWLELLRQGGHLVVTVPEERMYEQGVWPSTWNADHKTAWVVDRKDGEPLHIEGVLGFLWGVTSRTNIEILLIRRCEDGYDFSLSDRVDQTLGDAEASIEFVVRKLD